MDLFLLELMFNSQAMLPNMEPVLYTADVGLTAFWAALQPARSQVTELPNGMSRNTITFNATSGLFPDLSDEEAQALVDRISGVL